MFPPTATSGDLTGNSKKEHVIVISLYRVNGSTDCTSHALTAQKGSHRSHRFHREPFASA